MRLPHDLGQTYRGIPGRCKIPYIQLDRATSGATVIYVITYWSYRDLCHHVHTSTVHNRVFAWLSEMLMYMRTHICTWRACRFYRACVAAA